MEHVVQAQVERRERVVVDHVLGDPAEQPERPQAQKQSQGEMQAEILGAGEAPREE